MIIFSHAGNVDKLLAGIAQKATTVVQHSHPLKNIYFFNDINNAGVNSSLSMTIAVNPTYVLVSCHSSLPKRQHPQTQL
jgi:hypothetical protein